MQLENILEMSTEQLIELRVRVDDALAKLRCRSGPLSKDVRDPRKGAITILENNKQHDGWN